ncbi:unnamed protein product [Boreogadus saida]
MWFDQKAGRVTASNIRAACHTDPDKPAVSLLKKLCYPVAYKDPNNNTPHSLSQTPLVLPASQSNSRGRIGRSVRAPSLVPQRHALDVFCSDGLSYRRTLKGTVIAAAERHATPRGLRPSPPESPLNNMHNAVRTPVKHHAAGRGVLSVTMLKALATSRNFYIQGI